MVGRALGFVLAPLTGGVSLVRRSRMFHPEGVVYRVEVTPLSADPASPRLAGPALVRFSGAWWKRREWPDVLGLAIRFGDPGAPAPDDQDLLFATIRRPWTMPFAPLATRVHDYLANDYYGVSPFDVAGLGRRYLRIVPTRGAAGRAGDRASRLAAEVARGAVRLELQVSVTPRTGYTPFAELRIVSPLGGVDQAALRFSPFRDGRGIAPRGLVHAMRLGAYRASQAMRPASSSTQSLPPTAPSSAATSSSSASVDISGRSEWPERRYQ